MLSDAATDTTSRRSSPHLFYQGTRKKIANLVKRQLKVDTTECVFTEPQAKKARIEVGSSYLTNKNSFSPNGNSVSRRSSRAQFISTLHTLIKNEAGALISWTDDGKAFLIRDPDLFAETMLLEYCGHKTFTSFERQMNFYSFERMGEHEQKPSGKRYRKGSAIKYRHPNFHVDSTDEMLASIKRRTCPSNEKQKLTNSLKEAREEESRMVSKYLRLKRRIETIIKEIEVRNKAFSDFTTSMTLLSSSEDVESLCKIVHEESSDKIENSTTESNYNDQLSDIIMSHKLDERQISEALSFSI